MVDVVCSAAPVPSERLHADVTVRAGGTAVNAAIAAAAAGATATLVGRVGTDAAADLVSSELEARGVAATLARDASLATGAAVAFATGGVVAMRGANARLSVDDVPVTLDADALFVSGFALFQDGSAAAAQAAIDRFRGRWLGIDVASPRLAAVAREAHFAPPAGVTTVLFATADEARELADAEPEQAARTLAQRFTVACVKLGAEGAIAASGDAVVRARSDLVEAASPFGAGDAFAGTLLAALAGGIPLEPALEEACAAGARAAADEPS